MNTASTKAGTPPASLKREFIALLDKAIAMADQLHKDIDAIESCLEQETQKAA